MHASVPASTVQVINGCCCVTRSGQGHAGRALTGNWKPTSGTRYPIAGNQL
jgi:hypothetical protein